MLAYFDDLWTLNIDIAQLRFDRVDQEKNLSLKNKYYKDLVHFFKNHVPIKDKIILEQFITIKFGKEYLQGYIDAMKIDKDGNLHIVDWKTSTIYSGDKKLNECGQLVVYAIGLMQQGVAREKIRICWNFLKYTTVTKTLKAFLKDENNKFVLDDNGQKVRKTSKSNIRRSDIGESLVSSVKTWLKEFSYSQQEIDDYIAEIISTNSIACLPDKVKELYKFEDCYVYVDLSDDLINTWTSYVSDTIKTIRKNEILYLENKVENEKLFFEDIEDVRKQNYYFLHLCSYSANLHKPYKAFLESLEHKNEIILPSFNTSTATSDEESCKEIANEDLSLWLNDII